MLGLVQAAYLERTRFSAIVALRDDVLGVTVDAHAVFEPRHRRVRDPAQIALEQQRRSLRCVRRLQLLRNLRSYNFLLRFCTHESDCIQTVPSASELILE